VVALVRKVFVLLLAWGVCAPRSSCLRTPNPLWVVWIFPCSTQSLNRTACIIRKYLWGPTSLARQSLSTRRPMCTSLGPRGRRTHALLGTHGIRVLPLPRSLQGVGWVIFHKSRMCTFAHKHKLITNPSLSPGFSPTSETCRRM
jgi:hypothetical protein